VQNEKKLTKLAINIVFLSVNLYQTNRINVAIEAAAIIGQKQQNCLHFQSQLIVYIDKVS
jgi:hypothetical protein